jgi:hypothetical protein
MDVADALGVFMLMRAILPQECLQVLIDNSVGAITILDGHTPHGQTLRLKELQPEASAEVQQITDTRSEANAGRLANDSRTD